MIKISNCLCVFALGLFIIQGCSNNDTTKKPKPLQSTDARSGTSSSKDTSISSGNSKYRQVDSDSTISFFSIDNKSYIGVGGRRIEIPVNVQINSANIFGGIYAFRSDSLVRHKALIVGNYLFVTTFADLGRGYQVYLQAIDLANRRSIIDPAFKRNFLYSSACIFLLDKNLVFAVDKSFESSSKGREVTTASIYKIEGRYFHDLKDIYREGEQIPGDTTNLVLFFRSALSPKSKNVYVLPKNWWKRRDPYF